MSFVREGVKFVREQHHARGIGGLVVVYRDAKAGWQTRLFWEPTLSGPGLVEHLRRCADILERHIREGSGSLPAGVRRRWYSRLAFWRKCS